MKCSACKIIAHASCISVLMERSQLACKPTFRDVGVRQYREQTRTHHHWIHRRTEKGKCRQCGKVSNVIHAVIDLNCTLSMSNYPHGALSKFVVTQRKRKIGIIVSIWIFMRFRLPSKLFAIIQCKWKLTMNFNRVQIHGGVIQKGMQFCKISW